MHGTGTKLSKPKTQKQSNFNFGLIMYNPNTVIKQNFVVWIQTASLFMWIHNIISANIYKVVAENVQKTFDISNYGLDKPLP